jgi:hypothetical protein
MKYVTFAIAVLALGSLAFGAWTSQTTDRIIGSDDGEYTYNVRIEIDDDGVIHAVWREDAPTYDEMHYGKSEDGGVTWTSTSADQVISFPDGEAAAYTPDLAIDDNGNIYVVWSEDSPTNDEILFTGSTDGGTTWTGMSADQVISMEGDAYNALYPSIVTTSDGIIHVVWSQTSGLYTSSEIFYSQSTDGGATWSGTTTNRIVSFPDDTAAIEPDITVDSGDNMYVIWREKTITDSYQIHLSISTDGGATWSGNDGDYTISLPTRYCTEAPRITVDPFDNLHVVWNGEVPGTRINYTIYYTKSEDGGVTWSANTAHQRIEPFDGVSAWRPKIAADPCGYLYVVYNADLAPAYTHADIFVTMSYDGGETWTGDTMDYYIGFDDNEAGYRPDVAVDPDGNIHVVWTEFAGARDHYELHYGKGDPYCEGLCGDSNGDGGVTSADGYHTLNYFGAGPAPASCWAANVNGDGSLTTADGFHLLNYLGDPQSFPLNCAECEF